MCQCEKTPKTNGCAFLSKSPEKRLTRGAGPHIRFPTYFVRSAQEEAFAPCGAGFPHTRPHRSGCSLGLLHEERDHTLGRSGEWGILPAFLFVRGGGNFIEEERVPQSGLQSVLSAGHRRRNTGSTSTSGCPRSALWAAKTSRAAAS